MEGLYRVAFDVGDVGTPGAPILQVEALVYAPTGHISGHGEITQAIEPPGNRILIHNLHGRLFPGGINPQARAVTLTGNYDDPSLPPGTIPFIPYEMRATLVVDEGWNGQGTFTYGNHEVADVPVTQTNKED
jgi:hypothetical protein